MSNNEAQPAEPAPYQHADEQDDTSVKNDGEVGADE